MLKEKEVVVQVGTGTPAKEVRFRKKGEESVEVSFFDPARPEVESFALLSDEQKEKLAKLLVKKP